MRNDEDKENNDGTRKCIMEERKWKQQTQSIHTKQISRWLVSIGSRLKGYTTSIENVLDSISSQQQQ